MNHPLIRLGLVLLAAAVPPGAGARADENPEQVAALVATLSEDGDEAARAAAAERLGTMEIIAEGTAEGVVPALIDALALDLAYPVRGRAAQALGRLGPVTADVVPTLTEALRWDTYLMVRWRAAEALERIGRDHPATAAAIVPALLAALREDPYPGVRARAAQALGQVDPGDSPVVPALVQAFQSDSHPGVRWQAAAAMEGAARHYRDRQAVAAVADLRTALGALDGDPHPDIQQNIEGIREALVQLEFRQGAEVPQ